MYLVTGGVVKSILSQFYHLLPHLLVLFFRKFREFVLVEIISWEIINFSSVEVFLAYKSYLSCLKYPLYKFESCKMIKVASFFLLAVLSVSFGKGL